MALTIPQIFMSIIVKEEKLVVMKPIEVMRIEQIALCNAFAQNSHSQLRDECVQFESDSPTLEAHGTQVEVCYCKLCILQ